MPNLSSVRIKAKHDLKQALPNCIFSVSAVVKNSDEIPHGWFRVRITLIRSRATEKELRGGAIIIANTLPLLMSHFKR